MEAESSIPASGDNAFEAGMREAWRVFLQSRYRALWIIRVSRYKVSKWTGTYPGIVILLTVNARSRYNYFDSVLGVGTKAKTVTSFLIILSVLLVSAVKVASTNLSFGHQFICIFIY